MTRLGPPLHPARRDADIPRQTGHPQSRKGDHRVTEPSHRTSVLAVDDDPDLLLLLRSTVEGDGYRAILASDGVMALERIAQESPDVVCLDLMMPVMDGWQFRDEQRRDPSLSAIPVVVVTAAGQREGLRPIEADAWLPKPVDLDRLVQTLACLG
jgi:CheY-like chemotaxis protein